MEKYGKIIINIFKTYDSSAAITVNSTMQFFFFFTRELYYEMFDPFVKRAKCNMSRLHSPDDDTVCAWESFYELFIYESRF